MTGPTAADVVASHQRFDGGGLTNWSAMRANTNGSIDLGMLEHRRFVLDWLNRWGCRLEKGRDGNEAGTVTALELWWQDQQTLLGPIIGVQLADITDEQIEAAATAFAELSRSRASVRRTIGPTAASKVMMGLSPRTFPAWDKTIARAQYGSTGPNAYRAHLTRTRGWAIELGDGVADLVDDAAGITVAKLLDEWMYHSHTRAKAAARRSRASGPST